ncbi:helix-turn-helix domain-containing protein [Streptomyces sp. NPDC002513]
MAAATARGVLRPTAGTNHAEVSELERLLLLAEIANDVDGFQSLSEATSRLSRTVLAVMDCKYACVRLPDEQETRLTVVGTSDADSFPADEVLDLRSSEVTGPLRGHRPPSIEAFLTGQAQVVPSLDNEAGNEPWQERTRIMGVKAMLSLPLIRQGVVLGVLNCYWSKEFVPSDAQMLTLRVVGRLAALAVESARRIQARHHKEADLTVARDNSILLVQEEERLLSAQTELAAACARPVSAALAAAAQTLSERLHTAVGITNEAGDLIALEGPPDQVQHLATTPGRAATHHARGSAATAGYQPVRSVQGHLGMIVCCPPPPDDSFSHRLLAFAADLLTTVLQRRAEYTSAARLARPFALLALSSGVLVGPQIVAAADVLGIGMNSPIEVALAKFDTDWAATRFAAQSLSLPDWHDVIARAPAGREVVMLLEGAPRTKSRQAPDSADAMGLNAIGVSRRFSGLDNLPSHLKEARIAASAASPGAVARYGDLGPGADLAMHVPTSQLHALVEHQLGPLKAYDQKNGTELLPTLEAFLHADGCVDDVAAALTIHRNTVHQRLRRICDLCHVDFGSFNDLGRMLTVVQWNRYLEAGNR